LGRQRSRRAQRKRSWEAGKLKAHRWKGGRLGSEEAGRHKAGRIESSKRSADFPG